MDGIIPRGVEARAREVKSPKEAVRDLQARVEKDSMAIAITAAHGDTGHMTVQNPKASKESGTYMTITNNPTGIPSKWLSWSQTLKVQKSTTANNGLWLESQTPSLYRLSNQQQQTASFITHLTLFLKSV